jgi:hypothetical protein
MRYNTDRRRGPSPIDSSNLFKSRFNPLVEHGTQYQKKLLSVNKRRLIPLARVGKTMTYDADRRRNPSPIHTLALELPEQQVINAIVSTRIEPLAVICKAMNIQPSTYVEADALRTSSVRLPPVKPEALELAYGRLTPDGAARSLRFIKVRNTASAGN